jgi:opacity protein-like surface antigen
MKLSLKLISLISVLSPVVLSSVVGSPESAAAKPTGMTGNYVGAGMSLGAFDDGQDANAPIVGGNIQTRYAIPQAPVSLRGSAIFNDQSVALVPMVSVDVPVTNRANVYLGAGYSFVPTDNVSPLGNQNSFVISPGVEASINEKFMVYSDAKIGIDGFDRGNATAMSFQVGAGYRF